ncbi:MAG TPA: glycosyltransferase [Longimicrobiales bacterium]|nr:glycosyltransferase [Longimicrobiales bacterium]
MEEWPHIGISLPVYNEEAQIRGAVESLLALDYPRDRLHILVISDASSDKTDDIVRSYADQGVELLRMPKRGGKTVAETAGGLQLRGDIVVNTDASIRIRPDALKKLVRHFRDPAVGVASGRDVSVGAAPTDANAGEAGYVGYEMGVRALETRRGGIIGASGCFYAIRSHLHTVPLPDHLSRDFASALIAREHGFRSVSVDDAVCLVPRTPSLQREYRRKVRTISRGMQTLAHKHALLNPARYGRFAFMLWSHKIARWAVPPAAVIGAATMAVLALGGSRLALLALLAAMPVLVLSVLGWYWPGSRMPLVISMCTAATAANVAVLHAMVHAVAHTDPTWEPTRRQEVADRGASGAPASAATKQVAGINRS